MLGGGDSEKSESIKRTGKTDASEKNCRKFLEMTITKKWYPVTKLKSYQSLKIKIS